MQATQEKTEAVEDQRAKYLRLKQEMDMDLRFKSGMHEQVFALHNSVFVFEVDPSGVFLHTNLLFAEFTGYEPDQLHQEHFSLLAGEQTLGLPFDLRRAMLSGQRWTGQLPIETNNGRQKWITVTITPFLSWNMNRAYKYVCIGFDSTSQRRQKENLQRMIRQEKHYIQELEASKEDLEQKVEEKVSELKDSIVYSQRIQSALMPSRSTLSDLLPAGFQYGMLYLPRDIVSGDFYWTGEVKNETVLSVGDATGHGIPGAFMSILGISSLSRIVEVRGVTDPAEILTRIDRELRLTLQQQPGTKKDNASLEDSVEMAILNIPKRGNKVTMSAAMLTNFLVRNNGEVEDLKGTRKPLGGTLYDMSLTFRNETLEFQSGDTLYLLSDGFATQMGEQAQDYKPLGRKRLRNMLSEVQSIPSMTERMSVLESFLNEWKGLTQPQSDDIIIFALQFVGG